jgi:hypothetical protein
MYPTFYSGQWLNAGKATFSLTLLTRYATLHARRTFEKDFKKGCYK